MASRTASLPLLGGLAAYATGYVVLNALSTASVSVTLLMFYMAMCMCIYALSQRMYAAAFFSVVAAVLPFVIFDSLPRKIDGMYYEVQLLFGYREFFDIILNSIRDYFKGDSSLTRGGFLLILFPFINMSVPYEQFTYLPVNFLMISMSAILVRQLAYDFAINHEMEDARARSLSHLALCLFLLSPTHLFFSNDILKDQTSMVLVLLSVLTYLRKNYVALAIFLLLATVTRSYNVLIVAPFILAIRKPTRHDYLLALGYLGLLLVLVRFNFAAIINMIFATGYVYMNPLPHKPENWQLPIGFLTLQGVIFLSGFLHGLVQLARRNYRDAGLDRIFIGIALFGCLSIAVGFNNTVNLSNLSYAIGQGGDNMTRKCLPILPLVCIQVAFTFMAIRQYFSRKNNNSPVA